MRFEDHAYEAKENGHRYKSPNNVDSAHRLTIPPKPRRVGLLRLRRRSGACRQPLAMTRAGVRVSPESFATISSPRWTTDRSSRRIDNRSTTGQDHRPGVGRTALPDPHQLSLQVTPLNDRRCGSTATSTPPSTAPHAATRPAWRSGVQGLGLFLVVEVLPGGAVGQVHLLPGVGITGMQDVEQRAVRSAEVHDSGGRAADRPDQATGRSQVDPRDDAGTDPDRHAAEEERPRAPPRPANWPQPTRGTR